MPARKYRAVSPRSASRASGIAWPNTPKKVNSMVKTTAACARGAALSVMGSTSASGTSMLSPKRRRWARARRSFERGDHGASFQVRPVTFMNTERRSGSRSSIVWMRTFWRSSAAQSSGSSAAPAGVRSSRLSSPGAARAGVAEVQRHGERLPERDAYQGASTDTAQQRPGLSLQCDVAVEQEHDAIAQRARQVEVVGGQHDTGAVHGPLAQQVTQRRMSGGVEAQCRLVQQDGARIVHECLYEQQLPAHAVRVFAYRSPCVCREVQALAQGADGGRGRGARQAGRLGQELCVLQPGQRLDVHGRLGRVAECATQRPGGRHGRPAEQLTACPAVAAARSRGDAAVWTSRRRWVRAGPRSRRARTRRPTSVIPPPRAV
jgi:hypothetical protein